MSVGLLVSILIRLIAFFWSLLLLHRYRDWRMGFLSVMLALMALRQILTMQSRFTGVELTFSSIGTEWPGLIVSLMAFLAVFFVGAMLDERKQASGKQQNLIDELESQNAELERFTYTISHDLKTPLVTINGFLGYLRRHYENRDLDAFDRDIAKIENASAKMGQTLDELLQLSRVGRVVNQFMWVSLQQLTEEALAKLEAQIRRREVSFDIEPEMPEVFVDNSRLLEVLVILVDNAIKFADKQQGRIRIGARVEDDKVLYFVEDNGIGIDPEYHEYVFGLFDRLDSQTEGSGIGLTLARRIIEMHRGQMWVESDGSGSGSTFLFTLPKSEGAAEQAA